jgi:hypothetical protein
MGFLSISHYALLAITCMSLVAAQNNSNLEQFWSYGRSPAVYPSRKFSNYTVSIMCNYANL